jgi:hypothetical protein
LEKKNFMSDLIEGAFEALSEVGAHGVGEVAEEGEEEEEEEAAVNINRLGACDLLKCWWLVGLRLKER